MITVPRCLLAAGVALILASHSVATDTPGSNPNSDRVAVPSPSEDHGGQHQCRLDMRRPYEPGKVPVVLIHGFWGSPVLWNQMIEELEDDPALRSRYQFWTFGYASGDSIPFSAHLLRECLRRARGDFDPQCTDVAFDRMVVVGHS